MNHPQFYNKKSVEKRFESGNPERIVFFRPNSTLLAKFYKHFPCYKIWDDSRLNYLDCEVFFAILAPPMPKTSWTVLKTSLLSVIFGS